MQQTLDPMFQTNPATHPAALAYRCRACEARLGVLDETLDNRETGSERERALKAERRTLRGIRGEALRALGVGKPPRRLRDPKDPALLRKLRFLRFELRERVAGTLWNADRFERGGDPRNARLHRVNAIYFGETICRELGIDVALLAHCEPPDFGAPATADADITPAAISIEG